MQDDPYRHANAAIRRARAGETEWAMRRLVELAEAYADDERFSLLARDWALDCLLLNREFERWWDLSEPADDRVLKLNANLRANVAVHLGRDPHPFDLVRLAPGTLTAFSRKHMSGYLTQLRQVLDEHEQTAGPVRASLLRVQDTGRPVKLPVYLFRATMAGHGAQVALDHSFQDFGKHRHTVATIRALSREAENRLRDQSQVPRVGQGWVAETELFEAIRRALPGVTVVQHGRPAWLGRQHLDVWLPGLKIAVEYHGAQHFAPVDFFGGQDSFEATVQRDARKAELCRDNGVVLIVATEHDDPADIVGQVTQARANRRR